MTQEAIFACPDPRETHWQLGPLPTAAGDVVLFGWDWPEAAIEDEMPAAVCTFVAETLTSVARVTFLTSDKVSHVSTAWTDHGYDQVRTLPSKSLADIARTVFRRVPSSITMVSTRRPERAAALFDDASWPWHYQSQLVLLSPPEVAPPDIDRKTLLSLWNGEWNEHAAELRAMGVLGVLRPGVDGALFGILFLTRQFRDVVLGTFADCAKRAGYAWLQLSETEFSDRLQTATVGYKP